MTAKKEHRVADALHRVAERVTHGASQFVNLQLVASSARQRGKDAQTKVLARALVPVLGCGKDEARHFRDEAIEQFRGQRCGLVDDEPAPRENPWQRFRSNKAQARWIDSEMA